MEKKNKFLVADAPQRVCAVEHKSWIQLWVDGMDFPDTQWIYEQRQICLHVKCSVMEIKTLLRISLNFRFILDLKSSHSRENLDFSNVFIYLPTDLMEYVLFINKLI